MVKQGAFGYIHGLKTLKLVTITFLALLSLRSRFCFGFRFKILTHAEGSNVKHEKKKM